MRKKKAIKLGFQILKNMWLTKFQMICRNLQIFVRLPRGKFGAKINQNKAHYYLWVLLIKIFFGLAKTQSANSVVSI